MIQASRSPSSARPTRSTLRIGPLRVELAVPEGRLSDTITDALSLYDLDWSLTALRPVTLTARVDYRGPGRPAGGTYLECARMVVDTTPGGLRATTPSGATVEGRFSAEGERWELEVPADGWDPRRSLDVEDLLSLVVSTGWRRQGWVPLHAAGVTLRHRGVLVCAGSGGGKTTFTVAMIRRGWQTLGDDKLLLGSVDDKIVVAGVKHMLNLDPAAAAWFPELGELRERPPYSTWTPKRRVSVHELWPAAAASSMRPTHLLLVERRSGPGGVRIERLESSGAVLGGLLRQTVIPRDAAAARPLAQALGRLAVDVDGMRVHLHDDAYADPRALDVVEEALR